MFSFDSTALKKWFADKKRDLPWRHSSDPYAIWVSEMMLQQTQVAVVIPYFLRWMEAFPTIESLAKAPLDFVIKQWEGLGYYSRARHLHAGAQLVLSHFDGKLPKTNEELATIKGLGPYTIGAIRSFAYRHKAAAVDGNVMRVLARYFCLEEDISKAKTIKKIWQIAEKILPDEEPWLFNEALIELGATLCMRKPKCGECPVRSSCQSLARGKSASLPYRSLKTKIEFLHRSVAVISCDEHLLVKRAKAGQLMGDLHEFPYFETAREEATASSLAQKIETEWQLPLTLQNSLPTISHSFTRYQVTLAPFLFTTAKKQLIDSFQWIPLQQLKTLAFSSGHRRLLNLFLVKT